MKTTKKTNKTNTDFMFDEERIPNSKADKYVSGTKNFVGSHTYGEDIGGLNKMYVAYSYGEQHPLFVWVDKNEFTKIRPNDSYFKTSRKQQNNKGKQKRGIWFYNEMPYYIKDKNGNVKKNKWTEKHLEHLKPNEKVQARGTDYLIRLIKDFKKLHKIGKNSHTDLAPGEK